MSPLLIVLIALKLGAVLPPQRLELPRPKENAGATANLNLRRRIFRAPPL